MGSSCSSGQAHKDKDSISTKSEESPSYQAANRAAAGQSGSNHSQPPPAQPPPSQPQPTQHRPPPLNVKPSHDGLARAQRSAAPSTTSDSALSSPGLPREAPDVDDGHLPPALAKIPDNLKHLLLGRTASARAATRTKKIAIYVCAADSQDCCVEKGALHRNVYPALRTACRARGYELHVVDLHWKTPLEKQQDHEFPELCLGELARQQETAYVVPVLFLNHSLGTPLLPKTVETQDFEMALSKAGNKALLNKWYSLDSHSQPPCYTLRPTTCHFPGLKEECHAEDGSVLTEWRAEIERTLAVLVEVLPAELRDTYLSTALEQEVHHTVCMSQELARRTLWLHRVYTHQPPSSPPAATSAHETELKRRLDALHKDLKSQLVEKHILRLSVRWSEAGLQPELPEHAQYVAEVTAQLTNSLRGIVDAIIDEDQAKAVGKPGFGLDNRLVQELTHQTSVCQQAAQCSVNRDGVLAQIKSYVEGGSRSPLLLTGPRGCGKTTLVARAAQCTGTWTPAAPGAPAGSPMLAVRFAGVSADSLTTERILASLGQQCRLLKDGGHCWASHTVTSWAEQLPELLGGAAEKRLLVVMVDGLDQLRDYGSLSVEWVPRELPKNVKLILSAAEGSTACNELKQRLEPDCVISMPALDEAEARSILNAWIMQYNHSVPKPVQDCVLASVKGCTLPLYAKVLAWQTSWGDQPEAVQPKGSVEDQLQLLLDQLDAILGREQVEHASALISAAKYGVSDSEMLDLLAHDNAFHSTATYVPWAPACLFWARFNKLLAPFVQWVHCGETLVLQWRDATVRQAVATRYLGQEASKTAARALLEYFQGSWWSDRSVALLGRLLPMPNMADKCYNRRKLQELPYVSHAAGNSIKKDFLLDMEWIFDKICGADVFQVLEDIALEPSAAKDADVSWLRTALEDAAPALAFDGRQLYSQLFRRLSTDFPAPLPGPASPGDPAPEPKAWVSVPAGRSLPKAVLAACDAPPAPALLPLPSTPPEDAPDRLDLVVRIRDYPDYVVTVSTAKEEIAVWDVLRSERVRVLRGIPQPLNLQPIDSHRCIVLCQRELRLYDLDACTLLSKLKGVMNQKMPYFGLHDPSHLVALSRNRMYVNLMNLDSGDCVTTFKAGEDRFLNSLLVSGDGRVLVCGDETQKPFPLLVWNLASRKLLYDLRIPHHDFVTSLAAITHEGHYVCCVAQEVDEPSANFIVVYDLQSGTLFKKWKPGVNTVSLDISSRDGCVISGLEDGRVLIWDLITGNCRWTLSGHTAPVDYLRLDAQGGYFLSADSKCRDRSLRIWDLHKGTLVAVYTAERPVTACEVTLSGEVVVLAQEGAGCPTTLRLRGRPPASPPSHSPGHAPPSHTNVAPDQPRRFFGAKENHGRVVDFREADR